MSPAHGLTSGAHVYRIPDGVKYLVFGGTEEGMTELLQLLQGKAVQIIVDESYQTVFVWPVPNVEPQS